jgi:hypothetical protein
LHGEPRIEKNRSIRTSGIPFTRGPLAHLLRNHFYFGGVTFKDEILKQPAILDRDLFDAVQTKLSDVSGADPLNLVGILTPGAKLPALAGNRLLYRDGIPTAVLAAGDTQAGASGKSEAIRHTGVEYSAWGVGSLGYECGDAGDRGCAHSARVAVCRRKQNRRSARLRS